MIPLFKVYTHPDAVPNVAKVMASGMIGEGERVVEFTAALEKLFDNKQIIPLNSCTSALTLALRLIGIKPGDEVISPAFTMIATNCAIANFGAEIVFADVEKNGLNVSVDDIKKKITKKTKAIVVTHVGGNPCDMDQIMSLGIPVVVDAAHAVLTRYHDKHISHFGDYVCFSFQAIKPLNTGDGGAIVIRDEEQFKRAEKLKWFGMSRILPPGVNRLTHQMTSDVEEFGYKFHMNDISAAIGLANIQDVEKVVNGHRICSALYATWLSDTEFPVQNELGNSTSWIFGLFSDNREKLIKRFQDQEIQVSPMWRRNDEYSAFKKYELPNLDDVSKRILFIPNGWWMTPGDVEVVTDILSDRKL